MKISIKQSDLDQSLQSVKRVIPSRPQLPILQGVFLQATTQLSISATDLHTGVRQTLGAVVDQPGEIVVPAQPFADIIHALPVGTIELESDEQTLTIKTKSTQSTIQCLTGDEYPAFPNTEGEEITISATLFSQVVEKISFAAAKDETRPILTSLLFSSHQNNLRVVATDGFRLALLDTQQSFSGTDLLIPTKALQEMQKLQSKSKAEVIKMQVSRELKQLFCDFEGIELVVRLMEGEFPPYQKIMPPAFSRRFLTSVEDLMSGLRAAQVFSKDSSQIVSILFSSPDLTISATSPSLGTHQGSISCQCEQGESLTVAFNVGYLLDVLQVLKSGEIAVELNESLQPAMLSQPTQPGLSFLIMPFRANTEN